MLHKGEKPFQCSVCNKRSICNQCREYVESILSQHHTKHYVSECDKPFQCSDYDKQCVCNSCREYVESILIQYPIKPIQPFHTGERPYRCSVCDNGILRNQYREFVESNLIQYHTKHFAFKCDKYQFPIMQFNTIYLLIAKHVTENR